MKQINFSDGTTLCALGQGTWNMGRNPLNRKRETDALLLGIDLGMTMIDTAEMYANEEFVGSAIAAVRNVVFLVSKVLPEHASYVGTLQACEQNLKRLGTDRIDLYLLHWKGLHPFEETIKAMTKLQKEGKIVRWGVSNIDVDDMNLIHSQPNGGDCCANQVLYNLGERGVEFDLIPWSQQNNIVVIAYSPIAMGKLLHTPALVQVAKKHQASPAQIALAWTIRMEGVMAIPKAASQSHVRENFNALNISLDQEDIRLLDMAFPPPHRKIPLAGW
ncbi:MAG: aldo/keto reductase [Lachnospiraceae bacterium]|nr:aldo/keto reductase [Lachnospiraceae bacterium]